jgi:hypothetical protein
MKAILWIALIVLVPSLLSALPRARGFSTGTGGGSGSGGARTVTMPQPGWMQAFEGAPQQQVGASGPFTGVRPADRNEITGRFDRIDPKMNERLGSQRFETQRWERFDRSRLDGMEAPLELEERREKRVREREMFPTPRRQNIQRATGYDGKEAHLSNWDQVRETVLVQKYADAEVSDFADLEGRHFTDMVDQMSLRDINRFQFSSNRPDGPIPVQRPSRPSGDALPPPSPVFDPDPQRSSGALQRNREAAPPEGRRESRRRAEGTAHGVGPPPVERGEWTIEARVKE